MCKRFAQAASILYLLALLSLLIATSTIGERSWLLLLSLYLPRGLLLLPLLVLLPLLWWRCHKIWLGLPLGTLLVVLFPLMGLTLHLPHAERGQPQLRLVSYNVWFGRRGDAEVVAALQALRPDVVVAQATNDRTYQLLRRTYPNFFESSHAEYAIVSRYPIESSEQAPLLPGTSAPAYVRYTLRTPIGPVDLFSVHPYSPRPGIESLRGQGFWVSLKESLWPSAEAERAVTANRDIRQAQIDTIAVALTRAAHPVLVAGDTNLPTLSATFARAFGHLQDGFASVGFGFGYTFPAHKFPWMRIDRVLADRHFRFAQFLVGSRNGSDHCPVLAVIESK